jgi:hypothetical protein
METKDPVSAKIRQIGRASDVAVNSAVCVVRAKIALQLQLIERRKFSRLPRLLSMPIKHI